MSKCLWCGKETRGKSFCSRQCSAYYVMFLRNRISGIEQANSGYAYKGRPTMRDSHIKQIYHATLNEILQEG